MKCLFIISRARDLLFLFHHKILRTAKNYLKEMGRRLKTYISNDCISLENIKELSVVKDGQKKGLRKYSDKPLKNAANMPSIEKQRAVSYKVALKRQPMLLNYCDNNSIKSDKAKSLIPHDSNQYVRQEQDFSEMKHSKFHDQCITKEAVVMLERCDNVQKKIDFRADNVQKKIDFRATTDNSKLDLKNGKKVEKICSQAQSSTSQSECHGSLLLKKAVVVLERCEYIHEKSSDRSKTLLVEGGKAKEVPKKSGQSTKRKRDEKSKSAEEETSKPSKSKKQKVSGESKSSKKEIPDLKAIDFNNDSKSPNGNSWNFKISSWNVNGIRAWLEKNGISFLNHEQPDIMCIQETKCSDDKLPDEVQKIEGYHCYWLSGDKEGYSGVGLLSKEEPIKVEYGIGISEHDNEGRVITAEYDKFYLVSTYVPNAGRGLVRLEYRMKWDKDFRDYLKKLDAEKPVILTGDLNVAHEEIDLANPKTNKKNAGFTKEEREGFTTLLGEGFIDTFRHLYPDKKGAYTFWTYMMNARAKDVGWRLDYFVISERFTENLCDSVIRKEVYGSDHCPITLFLAL